MNTNIADFVIVGRGLAGSFAALMLSRIGDVALLGKSSAQNSNSYAAQGGVAAAVAPLDNPKLHAKDTIEAGAGLCNLAAVRFLTDRAPGLMRQLVALGVPFDRDQTGQLSLGLEGAHGMHRILHAGGDATGRHIMQSVLDALASRANVETDDDFTAVQLLKNGADEVIGVRGTYSGSGYRKDEIWLARRGVVLATGGCGRLFSHTTNPAGATGDGIALAYEAGAIIHNIEFVQFHPTALILEEHRHFLVSEAVRGAGARLVDEDGRHIMRHAKDDLGPRDVVARAIYAHQQKAGAVYLDTTVVQDFSSKFPTIYRHCIEHGMDPTISPLPVSPAAHFMMGGVAASMSGRTNIPGLFAIGEVASTGVHGANRLASNSLLECLVMASELASYFQMERRPKRNMFVSEPMSSPFIPNDGQTLKHVQDVLWHAAGVARNRRDLMNGRAQLAELQGRHPNSPAVTVASLVLEAALARTESRGSHYRTDYPSLDPNWCHVSVSSRPAQILI